MLYIGILNVCIVINIFFVFFKVKIIIIFKLKGKIYNSD